MDAFAILGALFNAFRARCPKSLKSTLWGTFRPGPRGTPVSGGRDRNIYCTPRMMLFYFDFFGVSGPLESEMGRIRFQRVRFQTPNSVSFGGTLTNPDLPLLFFDFLAFFVARILAFLSVFPFFPGDFRGSQRTLPY